MTVHSYDGISWLTKLDRLSELSASNRAMVFNNIGHLINAEMLTISYEQLDGRKAVGIDRVTKEAYGVDLNRNLQNLITRIRRGTYKPQPSRLTEIPKDDGSTRPLAISCFEDKLVQLGVSTVLEKIFEPLFLPSSFGFRRGLSCHDALRALSHSTFSKWNGAVVEIDIRKYFNTIPHAELDKILRKKISDKRFLRLIEVLITAPIVMGKKETENTIGCPQGSILSPILANIYLHCVIDAWFERIKQTHIRCKAELVRYADDMVFVFESQQEARRFFKVLPKRLNKFGLQLHSDKSQLIRSGHLAAKWANQNGRKLATYQFLGFTCYWGKSRRGLWRLKYTSRKDRFAKKLKGLHEFLWKHLSSDTTWTLKRAIRAIKGWVNYHAISDNEKRVKQFLHKGKYIILKWINRKGRKRPMPWKYFNKLLTRLRYPSRWKTTSMFI